MASWQAAPWSCGCVAVLLCAVLCYATSSGRQKEGCFMWYIEDIFDLFSQPACFECVRAIRAREVALGSNQEIGSKELVLCQPN
jgi:hypothetical protein